MSLKLNQIHNSIVIMETVANAFNLFINTDRNIPNGSLGDDFMIPLGQSPIVAGDDEHIRLTLDQFSMRKSWYDVNKNNNKFIVALTDPIPGAPINLPVYLDPGDWDNDHEGFAEMAGAKIQAALLVLGNLELGEVVYEGPQGPQEPAINLVTDKLTLFFRLGDAANNMFQQNTPLIQCFTGLGDAYLVLGGRRIVGNERESPVSSLAYNLNDNLMSFTSLFKTNLTPETHVYLAVDNQMSNNIATNSFTAENTQSLKDDREGMVSSRIMAAIPIDAYYAMYTSTTNRLFFIDLASRVATSLKLVLVDSCGRRFPYIDNNAEQGVFGDRSFKCTIRVDIIKGNKTGTLQTAPTPKSVPPRFSSTPAPVLNLGIPGYGLNVPGQVYGDGYNPLAK